MIPVELAVDGTLMIRVVSGGVSAAVEAWAVSPEGLAQILMQEPPRCEGQREITRHAGWRACIASKQQ